MAVSSLWAVPICPNSKIGLKHLVSPEACCPKNTICPPTLNSKNSQNDSSQKPRKSGQSGAKPLRSAVKFIPSFFPSDGKGGGEGHIRGKIHFSVPILFSSSFSLTTFAVSQEINKRHLRRQTRFNGKTPFVYRKHKHFFLSFSREGLISIRVWRAEIYDPFLLPFPNQLSGKYIPQKDRERKLKN